MPVIYKKLIFGLLTTSLLFGLFFLFYCLGPQAKNPKKISTFLEAKLNQIMTKMPLEAKVGQLFHVGIADTQASAYTIEQLQKYKVGGVILFAYNLKDSKQTLHLNQSLQAISIKASNIPLLISTDQEGGRVNRLGSDSSVHFPSAMALGQTNKPEYVKEAAFITGYELRRLGINWVLAPVLDINNNPNNPVINVRSFAADPDIVSRMGMAYVAGNRQALSVSAIKHFPGHGDTDVDSHYDLPLIRKSVSGMEKLELIPFRKLIQEGKAETVMVAHILFPFIDPQNPASLSKNIVDGLLRRQLGFQGLVSTDAMEMKAVSQRYPPEKAARLAFAAGVDVILVSKQGLRLRKMYQALLSDFQKQKADISKLNQAVRRQLRLKLLKGLFHRWHSQYVKQTKASRQDHLYKYTQGLERKADAKYQALQTKYKNSGIDLNTRIARASIASFRRPFAGLQTKDLSTRVRVLAQSQEVRQQALAMGVPAWHMYPLKERADIIRIHKKRKQGEIWLVEVSQSFLKAWQRLIEEQEAAGLTSGQTIALYSGDPYSRALKLPQRGALLFSYSDTPASRAALIYRCLYPLRRVPQARLGLPKVTNKAAN